VADISGWKDDFLLDFWAAQGHSRTKSWDFLLSCRRWSSLNCALVGKVWKKYQAGNCCSNDQQCNIHAHKESEGHVRVITTAHPLTLNLERSGSIISGGFPTYNSRRIHAQTWTTKEFLAVGQVKHMPVCLGVNQSEHSAVVHLR